jgi:23S rRNA (guanosine2251-2'-O)-methyltransferase
MTFVLENIRSAWNVGSIIRSCDALGCDIILVGYTPCPIGANLKLITKTSIGAEKTVKWRHFEHSQEVFEEYSNSVHIAIEINSTSQSIYTFLATARDEYGSNDNFLVWLGNEIHGVSELVQNQSKYCLHLPMNGNKESLNVSSCMCSVGYLIQFAFA